MVHVWLHGKDSFWWHSQELTARRIFLCSSVDSLPWAAGIFRMCSIRCQLPNIRRNPGTLSSKMSRRVRRSPYYPHRRSSPSTHHWMDWSPQFCWSLEATSPCSNNSRIFDSIFWLFPFDLCPLCERLSEVSLKFCNRCYHRWLSPGCSRRASLRSERQVSLYGRFSLWWPVDSLAPGLDRSWRPCCAFGVSTTRVNLGIDVLCSLNPLQSSCIPLFLKQIAGSVLKRAIACEFDRTATLFLWASFKLHYKTVFWWDF